MANASSSATPIAVERANTNGYTVIELIVAMALISGAMAIGGWFGHRLIQHCAHTRRDCDMLLNLMDFTSTLR
ncbi:MAG TPA: prepilin-type N-terminal cleavage/methylation domain-containing protein, partial [Armatimonadetes bacterium]|nr:prepilin-type N-terminal cleavage/methylation domain-containing protein [Armatimonadota bacterium]